MTEVHKPSVLRDVAVTTHTRPLGLPRHRAVVEVKATPAMRPAVGLAQSLKPAAVAAAAVAAPAPTPDETYQRVIDEERRAAREAGLKEGLADAQKRLDDAMREGLAQLEAQTEKLHAQHEAEHTRLAERVHEVLEGVEAALARRIDTLEEDAIGLAFEAVCRLLGSTRADRAGVAALVQQAIAQLRGGTLLRVRLHPDDLQALQGDTLQAHHPSVQWVADAKVTSGGCMLDTENGTLDARLDRQLQRLRDVWLSGATAGPSNPPGERG